MKSWIMLAAICALPFTLSCERGERPLPIPGNKAPSFTLQDLQGNDLRLSDLSGKIVIIDFWATWCHSCKELTSTLDGLQRNYQGQDVVVLGISMDRGDSAARSVREYADKHSLSYAMLMDDGTASKAYAVHNIPVTFIVDKHQVIVKKYVGYLPKLGAMIDDHVERLLRQ